MSTHVVVNTYTNSVVYVTDNLLRSFEKLIGWLGLDKGQFVENRETKELGIRTWLESRHLEKVILEIWNPANDELVGRWDANITYSAEGGDGDMWIDPDAVKNAIDKAGVLPEKCSYRLVVTNKDGRPDVAGWSPTTLRSTGDQKCQSVGSTIGSQHISAGISYWRK